MFSFSCSYLARVMPNRDSTDLTYTHSIFLCLGPFEDVLCSECRPRLQVSKLSGICRVCERSPATPRSAAGFTSALKDNSLFVSSAPQKKKPLPHSNVLRSQESAAAQQMSGTRCPWPVALGEVGFVLLPKPHPFDTFGDLCVLR